MATAARGFAASRIRKSVQNRGSSAAGAPSEGTTTCNNEREIAARTMEKPLDDQKDVSSRPRDLSYVFKLAANLGSYILLSRRLMVTLKSKSGASWLQRILPSKIREMRLFSKRSLVWRDDMESFTVDLMRQRIISELSYLGRRPGTYLVKCTTLDEVSLKKQVAGVLWFRSHPIAASRAREETQNSETERGDQIAARTADAEPPPFATLLLGKEEQFHVLVYNLPHLLGNQHLAELQRRLGIENPETAPFTVIKAKRNTLQAQMWLWKLQMLLDSQ
ncbi:MAG: hypothetical protein M1825_004864 [Sarcosagium campestre]|nr:MAG: hypothetical protein M1825_004864 [Sarcosagium campestre]